MSSGSGDDDSDSDDTPDQDDTVEVPLSDDALDLINAINSEMRRNQDWIKEAVRKGSASGLLDSLSGLQKSVRELKIPTQPTPNDLGIKPIPPKPHVISPPPNPVLTTNELLSEQQEAMASMQVAMGELAEHAAEEKVDRQEAQRNNALRFWISLVVSGLAAIAAIGALIVMLIAPDEPVNVSVTLSPQDIERLANVMRDEAPLDIEPEGNTVSAYPSTELRPPW